MQSAETTGTAELERARHIAKQFRDSYKQIKDAINQGNEELANQLAAQIQDVAEQARAEIANITKSLGQDAAFGTELGNKLASAKGQITKTVNLSNRAIAKSRRQERGRGEAVSTGQEIAAGMEQGIDQGTNRITSITQQMAEALITAAEDILEIQSPSKVFTRIGQQVIQGLKNGLDSAPNIAQESIQPFVKKIPKVAMEAIAEAKVNLSPQGLVSGFLEEINDLINKGLEPLKEKLKAMPGGKFLAEILEKSKLAKDAVVAVAAGFLGFQVVSKVFSTLFGSFEQLAAPLLDAGMAMESLERRIGFVSSSSQKASQNLSFVRSEVKRLGIDLKSSMDGFAGLMAASRETPLEGDPTKQIFSGIAQASTVYDLDAQQQERVFTATQQMMSKGVVSSEELRQQLGESLPGAFQVAARAMGVTTQELSKMLEQGQVLSEDFLPKFAQQLSAETANGVAGAANSSVGAVTSFNNAVLETQAALGKGLLPGRNLGLKVMAGALKFVNEKAQVFLKILSFLSVALGGMALKAVMGMIGGLKLLGAASLFSVAGLKAITTAIAPLLLKFALFTAVIDTITIIGKAFKDAGGQAREFANTAITGMKKYREILAETREEQAKLGKELPKTARDVKGESLLESTFIGGLLPKEVTRFIERGFQKTLGLRTYQEQKTQDRVIAENDLVGASNDAISEVYGFLGASGKGSQELAVIKQIDKQLSELQIKRRGLIASSPNDMRGVKELQAQEAELLKRRESAFKPLGALQGNINTQIDAIKKQIADYEELAAEGQIDQETYTKQVTLLKNTLESAEKAQNKFTRSIGENATVLQQLQKNLALIADRLADANQAAQISSNQARAGILKQQAAGNLTQEQAGFALNAVDEQLLAKQLREQLLALQEQQALLSTDQNQNILESYGVSQNLGTAGFSRLADKAGDGTPEKVLFEQMASMKEQELQISELEVQLAQRRADTQQQLIDLNKQVEDYYRGIERQSQELAIEAQQAAIQTEFQGEANKLKEALLGTQDNIVGQFVESLIESSSKLADESTSALDAQSQLLANEFELQDTLRSGVELQRQLPGNLPKIPVELDFSGIPTDNDLSQLNTEVGEAVDSTQSLTRATQGYSKELGYAENAIASNVSSVQKLDRTTDNAADTVSDLENKLGRSDRAIQSNVASTGELVSGIDTGTLSTEVLGLQIDSNNVSLEGTNLAVQTVDDSLGQTIESTGVVKAGTDEWLGSSYQVNAAIHGEINPGLAATDSVILQLINKTVEWFQTWANNVGIFNTISGIFSSWGQTLSGIGQGIANTVGNIVGGITGRSASATTTSGGQFGYASPSESQNWTQVLNGSVSSGQDFFGSRDQGRRTHYAVDFDSTEGLGGGAPLNNMFTGVVDNARAWGRGYNEKDGSGKSNAIRVKSQLPGGGHFYTVYGHVKQKTFKVKTGDQIAAGQRLGNLSNDDIKSSGGHLDLVIEVPAEVAKAQGFTTGSTGKASGFVRIKPKEFMRWYQKQVDAMPKSTEQSPSGNGFNTALVNGSNDLASALVKEAEKWVGKDFKKGVTARCADFVRHTLSAIGVDLGVTKKPVDAHYCKHVPKDYLN
ncbi:MAG: tape measure protein [Symploca sp. SIO2G7]|nr:tape measure protein [Symploca sp. SIO2G7]